MTSGPLVALVVEGDQAIEVVRGADRRHRPEQQLPGPSAATCRCPTGRTSSTPRTPPESAAREIKIFFPSL